MSGILDIPRELLDAFVADPLCQLRYTCKWFLAEMCARPFKISVHDDFVMFISSWYSVKVGFSHRCVIDDWSGCSTNIYHLMKNPPPFITVGHNIGAITGSTMRRSSNLPFLYIINSCNVYKCILYRSPIKCASVYIDEKWGATPSDTLAMSRELNYDIRWVGSVANYVDSFTLHYMDAVSPPAYIYKKMTVRDVLREMIA